jgi:hypothetical protein
MPRGLIVTDLELLRRVLANENCNAVPRHASPRVDSTIEPDSFLQNSMVPEDIASPPELDPLTVEWPETHELGEGIVPVIPIPGSSLQLARGEWLREVSL